MKTVGNFTIRAAFAAGLLAALWSGCGIEDVNLESDGYEQGEDGDDPADAEAPGDGDGKDDGNGDICDEQEFDIHRQIVRLMLLLDQSSSMIGERWTQATWALQSLLVNEAFYDMHFGLDAFPDGYPGFWWNCNRDVGCYPCPEDMCGTLAPPQVMVAPRHESSSRIIEHMNDPAYPAFCGYTPLVRQLEYYATGPGPTEVPAMYGEDGDSYLVVISDGQDEGCFSGNPTSALAEHAEQLREDHGIRSFAIGFGDTTGETADELNAIASNGGTPFTSFLHAEDGDALEKALNGIAGVANTCRYVIDDVDPSANPELVNFYLDGELIPMDEDCTDETGSGWHWYDDEHTTVEFCGDHCTRIKEGSAESISATFGCRTYVI